MKERLDVLLVNRGLAPSREKAKTMIMEGNVFVNNNREDKAGSTFPDDCNIEIHGKTLQYVSRGGLKLEKAMKHFDITMDGKVCMDIGASTGGFTDCMLQNGAKKVYAVDAVSLLHCFMRCRSVDLTEVLLHFASVVEWDVLQSLRNTNFFAR